MFTATLTISATPTFYNPIIGTSVILNCVVTSGTATSITWLKDNLILNKYILVLLYIMVYQMIFTQSVELFSNLDYVIILCVSFIIVIFNIISRINNDELVCYLILKRWLRI
jgi:hypothetical protein